MSKTIKVKAGDLTGAELMGEAAVRIAELQDEITSPYEQMAGRVCNAE